MLTTRGATTNTLNITNELFLFPFSFQYHCRAVFQAKVNIM